MLLPPVKPALPHPGIGNPDSNRGGSFRHLPALFGRWLAGIVLVAAVCLAVQANASEGQKATKPSAQMHAARRPAHARTRHLPKSKAGREQTAAAAAPPQTPTAPPKPNWPANQPPAQPSVTWDSRGLRIEADNSSLRQILDDIASKTGAKIQGISHDERIFGDYGPAPARDVLSQLLHGSGYNVLMIGDQGEGTPREVVLSARNENPAPQLQTQPTQTDDENQEIDEEQPPAPGPIFNRPPMGMPNQAPQLTPQLRWEQMQQQRLQQMRQQIQQNQPQQDQPQQ